MTGDAHIQIARSDAGGRHFGTPRLVAWAPELALERCGLTGNGIAAQPKRCVTPAPLVSADRERARVYVTYSASPSARREQNVYVSSYRAATLQPLLRRRRVNPPDGRLPSDQFLPASAVDESTGRLWACWYDTTGDRARKRVRYTCSASSDGGRTWAQSVRAASVFSNETVEGSTSFGYGDYAGLTVAKGVAHPMWTDSRDLATLHEEIYTTQLELP